MPIKKVVIPVAGMGTSLLPATKSQPKEMLAVGRKPVVQYVVEEMVEQDLEKILFITGRDKRSIEDHFDRDPELSDYLSEIGDDGLLDDGHDNVNFYYTRQIIPEGRTSPSGIGHAVLMSRDFVSGEPFVVALGDTIIKSGNYAGLVRRMIKAHERHAPACTIAVVEIEEDEVSHYGIVKPKGRGRTDFEIDDIVEKPSAENAPSRLAVAARYVFEPVIFDALDRTTPGFQGRIELTDAIKTLLRMGHKVRCIRLKAEEKRYDIGNHESYFRAFIDFAISDQQYGYRIRQYFQKRLKDF